VIEEVEVKRLLDDPLAHRDDRTPVFVRTTPDVA
jgi:hypothetical protein